jgi:hypothetical protein
MSYLEDVRYARSTLAEAERVNGLGWMPRFVDTTQGEKYDPDDPAEIERVAFARARMPNRVRTAIIKGPPPCPTCHELYCFCP